MRSLLFKARESIKKRDSFASRPSLRIRPVNGSPRNGRYARSAISSRRSGWEQRSPMRGGMPFSRCLPEKMICQRPMPKLSRSRFALMLAAGIRLRASLLRHSINRRYLSGTGRNSNSSTRMLGLHILIIRRCVSMVLRGRLGPAIGAARLVEVQLTVDRHSSRFQRTAAHRSGAGVRVLAGLARQDYWPRDQQLRVICCDPWIPRSSQHIGGHISSRYRTIIINLT